MSKELDHLRQRFPGMLRVMGVPSCTCTTIMERLRETRLSIAPAVSRTSTGEGARGVFGAIIAE